MRVIPTFSREDKPKRRTRYAWLRYMKHPNGYFVPDMSGFIEWATIEYHKVPEYEQGSSISYQLNNPWIMMEQPPMLDNKLTMPPNLQEIEWKIK